MLPKIENDTDFVAEPHLLADKDGEKLCAIVKATFELVDGPPRGADGSFVIAPKLRRRRCRGADVPWGEEEKSSILLPADLCIRKPATDVIVVAAAHAPGGEAVPSFDAGVRLGKVSKVVRVTGTRVWVHAGDAVTEPQPLKSLEMRYDWAFGGADDSDPKKLVEDPRNPVGLGIRADLSTLDRTRAPQIEDPLDPVVTARSRPRPAGLSAIGRQWEPRRKYWGTYDADWLENRAPLLPPDFDDRANQAATPELVHSPHLRGGEEGALTNLTPLGGTIAFVLPRVHLGITFRVKDQKPVAFTPGIDTVILDTLLIPREKGEDGAPTGPPVTKLVLELVYRAHIVAPRRLADATIIVEEKRR